MCEARNFAACVDEIYDARREIYSVKYEIKFHSAAHGDKIYGAITDDKFFGTALAGVRNFGLKNARVNLRPRNAYEDLKFKGSANFEPAGGVNFKFKNNANPRLLCGGNAKPIKSNGSADALNPSGANKILASVWTGRILSPSAEAGILASIPVNEILNLSAAGEILKSNAVSKTLNLGAVSRTDIEFKGAGGC